MQVQLWGLITHCANWTTGKRKILGEALSRKLAVAYLCFTKVQCWLTISRFRELLWSLVYNIRLFAMLAKNFTTIISPLACPLLNSVRC